MSSSDPILDETNVSSFLAAINKKYTLTLPTDFSGDSPISQLLKQPITVSPGDEESVAYTARGSPLDFLPFNFGVNLEPPLNMIVIITIAKEAAPTEDMH